VPPKFVFRPVVVIFSSGTLAAIPTHRGEAFARMQAHSQLLSSLPCPHLTPLGHFSSHRQQRQSKARPGERPYAEARREAARRQHGEARARERRRGERPARRGVPGWASTKARRRSEAWRVHARRSGVGQRKGAAAPWLTAACWEAQPLALPEHVLVEPRSSSCTTSLALPDGSVLISARWKDSPQCASSFSSTLRRPGARALAARRWPRTYSRSSTR
jgi:hypothetical protein